MAGVIDRGRGCGLTVEAATGVEPNAIVERVVEPLKERIVEQRLIELLVELKGRELQ